MTTSHVSLPSQIGATVPIMVLRRHLVARQPEENADAEIEAVEQNIQEHAEREDEYPEHDHSYSPAAT